MNPLLEELLEVGWPQLSQQSREKIQRFYASVLLENQKQNLTRLITPQDFFEGHILDVKALLASGLVEFPALEIGSGCGVPGLLSALLDEQLVEGSTRNHWVLTESEKRKAEFLSWVVKKEGLHQVLVLGERVEKALQSTSVRSVVARAVGRIEKIMRWIQNCSTWNNLVLLKGPGWEEEWKNFRLEKKVCPLVPSGQFEYQVGEKQKQRVITRLVRVPRGTILKNFVAPTTIHE